MKKGIIYKYTSPSGKHYIGKTVLPNKAIDILFNDFFGFIPERGDTISII